MRARFALVLATVALAGCAAESDTRPEPTERPERTERPEPTPPQGALDQMELVFVGSHSQEDIQAKLDPALALFGLEPTEENYRNAGDVLVALRNHNTDEAGCPACTEMAILDYMLATGPLEGMEWHEAAAWASSFLVAEGGP